MSLTPPMPAFLSNAFTAAGGALAEQAGVRKRSTVPRYDGTMSPQKGAPVVEHFRGMPELVSLAQSTEDCLVVRQKAMTSFDGLGPVDLCCLTKAPAGGQNEEGRRVSHMRFFHYVIGLNTPDASSVSQYMALLIKSQDRIGTTHFGKSAGGRLLKAVFGSQMPHWKIVAGTYCCYDAISRMDVRVHVEVPGIDTTRAYAVNADGREVLPTRAIWEGAHLSAFLRSLQQPARFSSLRSLPMFSQPEAVETFVALATKYFETGDSLGSPKQPATGSHIICELLGSFLLWSRRLRLALEVFPSLQALCPSVASQTALAYFKRGQRMAGLQVLARAIHEYPEDGPALHCQCMLLLEQGDCPELAVAAGELAVQLQPSTWRFWVTLAQAYLQVGRSGECLACLNSSSFKMCEDEVSLAAENGLPDLELVEYTMPSGSVLRSHLPTALRPAVYELVESRGVAFSGFGFAFGLNPGLDDSANPDQAADIDAQKALLGSRGAQLSVAEGAAYGVLVCLFRKLGWDGLLDMQSKTFIVAEDRGFPLTNDGGEQFQKRVLNKFLANLFDTLHSDLKMFHHWVEEAGGAVTPRGGKSRSCFRGSAEFWMRRGALADRLQQDQKAELAFRLCQARGTCPKASLKLLKLYQNWNRVRETIAQLAVLCGFAMEHQNLVASPTWPDWLFEAATQVVCRFGFAAIQAAFVPAQLPESCHPYTGALSEILHAVRTAGTEGVDR
eukprot:TRINITY_DN67654_c0_g1_i1.p1 TRINITY_DN67654_c0_g1~~TRINITY_DN67654_c0_g1_i1.p1  ORF type:complete len:727 (+),score=112.22 TRINITY_DN67654_c0_g1_i1:69-2249(+)